MTDSKQKIRTLGELVLDPIFIEDPSKLVGKKFSDYGTKQASSFGETKYTINEARLENKNWILNLDECDVEGGGFLSHEHGIIKSNHYIWNCKELIENVNAFRCYNITPEVADFLKLQN
jgi:hypothetical protein